MQNRRRFLTTASLACASGLVGIPRMVRAEPPPETTVVRLPKFVPPGCEAPQYLARELLSAEGFTDIRYVGLDPGVDSSEMLARGDLDFDWNYAATNITLIEAGVPIVMLSGLHPGCLELIAREDINSVKDLKGRRVGPYVFSSTPHILLMLMAAYVGLDPAADIEWVANPEIGPMQLFIDGKIDAFLGTAPEPQLLRAQGLGHTILDTSVDDPWSQYYCCMLATHKDYAERYPVATKRVLRAVLKAVDICASDPQRVERALMSSDSPSPYGDYLRAFFPDIRYGLWRDFDPEDTVRFYALRMREAGFIKSSPQPIIAAGTDWRFLDEVRQELKT